MKPPVRLPGTRQEAEQVAALYGSRPLLGTAATEGAVRRDIGRARILHFATHGYFLADRPMSSGVLLSSVPQQPGSEGTGRMGCFRPGRSSVSCGCTRTWPCCQPARRNGTHNSGRGGDRLTWALEHAGVRSVVSTRWKVPDAATAALMLAFHRSVRDGVAKDSALRNAIVTVRRQKGTSHPYYWSSVALSGSPDPIVWGRGR